MNVLASIAAAKRTSAFTKFIWLLAGTFFTILIPAHLVWGLNNLDPDTQLLLLLTTTTYVSAFFTADKLIRFPSAGDPVLIYAIGASIAAFSILGLILLAARLYYSRGFLFSAGLSTTVWLTLGLWFEARIRQPVVGLLPGSSKELSKEASDVKWLDISSPDISNDVDIIVADLHHPLSPEWQAYIADKSVKGTPVIHSARVYELLNGRVSLDHLNEIHLDEFRPHPVYALVKRILDVLFVIISAPIIVPIMLITALLIKMESPGPILFTQERIGEAQEPFSIYKFRSMLTTSEIEGAKFADENDSRVTRVGKFIRKFRIDELPQIYNIIKGEMSLIGPRPEQASFVQEFSKTIPFYPYRHTVKPGITGWAQVAQGYAACVDSTKEKLEYDFYYIKNISMMLDIYIAFRTVKTILTGFGSR